MVRVSICDERWDCWDRAARVISLWIAVNKEETVGKTAGGYEPGVQTSVQSTTPRAKLTCERLRSSANESRFFLKVLNLPRVSCAPFYHGLLHARILRRNVRSKVRASVRILQTWPWQVPVEPGRPRCQMKWSISKNSQRAPTVIS